MREEERRWGAKSRTKEGLGIATDRESAEKQRRGDRAGGNGESRATLTPAVPERQMDKWTIGRGERRGEGKGGGRPAVRQKKTRGCSKSHLPEQLPV